MSGLSSEGSEEAATTQQPPNPPTLSLDEHGDHLVPVKIDGNVTQMRLRDAVRGVAHREAVTKAMADLDLAKADNQKYERFFDQLKQDPSRIISALSERFGVTTTPTESPEEPQVEQPSDEVLALTQRVDELMGKLQTQQEQQARDAEVARINRRLEELKAEHGDGFDSKAVLAYAVDRGINDIDLAFRSWYFENKVTAVPTEEAKPKAADNAALLDSIAPGSPTATPPPPAPEESLAKLPIDAVRRALEMQPEDSPYRVEGLQF